MRLLSRYRAALLQLTPGTTLWLAPTWRAAADVRWRLFDSRFGGCFSPGVMTFERFAETILHSARLPIRPMTRLMKRELIRQIIGEQSSAGRLRHFQSIATTGGLVDLVCEFISELKRLEIWPEEFHRACRPAAWATRTSNCPKSMPPISKRCANTACSTRKGGSGRRGTSSKERKAESGKRKTMRIEKHRTENHHPFRCPRRAVRLPLSAFRFPGSSTWSSSTASPTLRERSTKSSKSSPATPKMTIVALPLEPEPRRADLFAKPLQTLAEFRRRHGNLVVEEIARPASNGWPAMAQLEPALFSAPGSRGQGSGVRGQGSTATFPRKLNHKR